MWRRRLDRWREYSVKRSFDIIENNGPNNLRDILKAKLPQASEVCIAVAFVTQSGLDIIAQPLREVAAQGKVRLITGLYQRVTEPQALDTLLEIQNESRGRFSVRLSKEPQFHRKVYLLENRTQATAIVGSSNLTKEGLQSGGELNLLLSLPKNSPSFIELKGAFEKEWKHRAVPLSDDQIKRYIRTRFKSIKSSAYTKSQLKSILGTEPIHKKASSEPIRFWRDCITGFAAKRTEQIISETTNWDDKNYHWFSTGGNHPYQIQDCIFLFDQTNNHIRLVEVKDMTRTPIPTPDGRRFVAYKPLRKYDRRLSQNLWALLVQDGIKEKNSCQSVSLSQESADHLMNLVRKKRRG